VLSRVPLIGRLHPIIRAIVLLVLAILVYLVVTGVQVWLTSREFSPQRVSAIVVMGAAQYNGTPSPDLQARLNEALILYRDDLAPLVVVTGYKEKGRSFSPRPRPAVCTWSTMTSRRPRSRRSGGWTATRTWPTLPRLLKARHDSTVLITTDPFHEDRSMAISSGLGLVPFPAPTRTSPINGFATVPYFLKEAIAVGAGRIIGYRELNRLRLGFG